MSAIDEQTASSAGKSTQGGDPPSVGEATRTLTLPQAPYGDAVHAALVGAGLLPDVVEAGLRAVRPSHPELFLRVVWLPGHPDLAAHDDNAGLTLAWSHVTGWSVWIGGGGASALLNIESLAAPDLVADAAWHYAAHGIDTTRPWVPPADVRWAFALELDIALVNFEEREVGL